MAQRRVSKGIRALARAGLRCNLVAMALLIPLIGVTVWAQPSRILADKTYGAWTLSCKEVKHETGDCALVQGVRDNENQVFVSLAFSYDARGAVVISAYTNPIPFPEKAIAILVDNHQLGSADSRDCTGERCRFSFDVPPDKLALIDKGQDIEIQQRTAPRQARELSLQVSGLQSGLDAMHNEIVIFVKPPLFAEAEDGVRTALDVREAAHITGLNAESCLTKGPAFINIIPGSLGAKDISKIDNLARLVKRCDNVIIHVTPSAAATLGDRPAEAITAEEIANMLKERGAPSANIRLTDESGMHFDMPPPAVQ